MSLAYAAPFSEEDKPVPKKNKTIRNRPAVPPKKVSYTFLEDSDDDDLADFVPPPPPKIKQPVQKIEGFTSTAATPASLNDGYVNRPNPGEHAKFEEPAPWQQPTFSTTAPLNLANLKSTVANMDNTELVKKLNYMIHLLEEQKGERVNNITEELVLYVFLGVFVIFVVDSFARTGKYTR